MPNPLTQEEKQNQMDQIANQIENLTESPLYAYRQENHYLPVIGEGDLGAKIMFVGEAPGAKEAQSGRPFVGSAGKVLNEMLAQIGLEREDVYITNIVKDRPPKNRDPKTDELDLYAPFLVQQIEIIQPRVIATLGRFSMDFLLALFQHPAQGQKIGELHGQALTCSTSYGAVQVLPLYHPAATFYNRSLRPTFEADFQKLAKESE